MQVSNSSVETKGRWEKPSGEVFFARLLFLRFEEACLEALRCFVLIFILSRHVLRPRRGLGQASLAGFRFRLWNHGTSS